MNRAPISRLAGTAALSLAALLAGCERPPVEVVQRGYRGTGMDQVYNPRIIAGNAAVNAMPADPPMVPPGGPAASAVFKNVQVVGDLGVGEFTRLMVSITAWVSPQQGCAYCHKAGEDFSSDSLYTKVVARRMLQMNRNINADWKPHVGSTGVTCYTCHRGLPVPANLWTFPAPDSNATKMAGNHAGQNSPQPAVGYASLPFDPFTPFLSSSKNDANDIRVIGPTALQTGNRRSTKQTEYSYGLMMHMSQALGVNCTYCHNSRSFAEWDSSTPQRATAWYGIRLARDLNTQYIAPLATVLPAGRLGPMGDAPKVNCTTCHQGAFKPMYGASLLATHPELIRPGPAAAAGSASAPASAPASVAQGNAVLLFAVGSAALARGRNGLQPVLATLQTDPGSKVVISGYHSASGDLAQNQELAKQRAQSVQAALKAAGVADDRVVLEKPRSAEANLAGEDPASRRVEVGIR